MPYLIRLILTLASLALTVSAAGQPEAFFAEDEVLDGWYHSNDRDTWIAKGADGEVIDAVMAGIADSTGERHHPELVDTQIAYAPGNWAYEWVQAGDRARQQAQSMEGEARLRKLREALAYYTTGSWPHLGRSDDVMAYEKAVAVYLEAGQMMTVPVQHIQLTVSDKQVGSYLHLPAGEGPFPLVINSFGSDVSKEDSFELFHRELEPRGIAMMAVDMPGLGEARDLSMANGSDAVMEAALNWAQGVNLIDNDEIFMVGGSFGGNAAARAFYRLPVAGVVSMCGPLHSPFMAPPEFLDQLPLLTIEGVKSRFKMLDQSTSELTALTPGTSLVQQGLMGAGNLVDTPLLVITTNRDPVAPLEDLEIFMADASDAELILLDMEGHCPPRTVREPIIARWVADQILAQQ